MRTDRVMLAALLAACWLGGSTPGAAQVASAPLAPAPPAPPLLPGPDTPQTTEPQTTEPQTTEPQPSEPQPSEPQPSEPRTEAPPLPPEPAPAVLSPPRGGPLESSEPDSAAPQVAARELPREPRALAAQDPERLSPGGGPAEHAPPEPPVPLQGFSGPDAKDPPLPSAKLLTPSRPSARGAIDDNHQLDPVETLDPTRFHGLAPGHTTRAEVEQALGKPAQIGSDGDAVVWSYRIGPFPRADITLLDDIVQSIQVHVEGRPKPTAVASQLKVNGFRSAWIFDGRGRQLGLAYPERGVLLGLKPSPNGPRLGVSMIVLEPVHAELFVLRARNEPAANLSRRIEDLDRALQLTPGHPEASGLKARLLASLGDRREALKLAEQAVQADPEAVEWQLLSLRLQASLGSAPEALRRTRDVLDRDDLPAVLRAEAETQAGDLAAQLGQHEEAMEHHLRAIELAGEFRESELTEVRRAALRVLCSAHLGAANDISWGKWRRKSDVVPQWVKSGHHFADLLISAEGDDPLLAQRVQRLTLSAYDGFAPWIDASQVCRTALEQGQELIDEATDPLYRQRAEWELAETMFYAVRIERQRGDFDSAVEFAKVASPIFAAARNRRELTPRESYLVGQLHFLAGSCLAIEAENHGAALQWYDAGAMLLLMPFPPDVIDNPALLGDQLVSMAVSYWKQGKTAEAIEITRHGVKRLQQGLADRKTSPEALRVAYGNLSAMLRAEGRGREAAQWESRLARLPAAPIVR